MDSVEVVPLSLIHTVWPDVEKFLKDGLAFCEGDYTVEQTKVYITKGEWMLVVAVSEDKLIKGAAAVNIYNLPNDRVAFVITMGGKGIVNKESFNKLKTLVKSFGATKVQGAVRESMARFWTQIANAKERYKIVEVKI
jgi:hypothetical protein